ncbi:MAG: NYN domain-containing protein [Deltaproteobacteria bacterium]|nr:NYN domain-containing protein [Deltaproteobacteria bacterium]
MSQPATTTPKQPERATCFVDGSNFYHGLKEIGVHNLGQLDFAKIAKKLCGPRTWTGLRYYVGQLSQADDLQLYSAQRAFVMRQKKLDARISFHMGRIEPRRAKDKAAKAVREYVEHSGTTIAPAVRADLLAIAKAHEDAVIYVEKAVDVMLAVDLVILAERNEYDTAYVLAADGDYTHAVGFVRSRGKRVFAVSATTGAQLAAAVDSFIRIPAKWLRDCYI